MSTQATVNRSTVEEVRIALLDVRQAFSEQKMEIQLLEEKVTKLKPATQTTTSVLESRIRRLEKTLEKIESDLHQLSAHANQTTESLVEYRNQIQAIDSQCKIQTTRLDEIAKLKGTLNSISQAISKTTPSDHIYTVRSGDSLEKIARKYDTSVDSLKKLNRLSNNTILIGQELKIPE